MGLNTGPIGKTFSKKSFRSPEHMRQSSHGEFVKRMIDLPRITFACPRTRLREAGGLLRKKNLLASLNLLEKSNASDFDFEFVGRPCRTIHRAALLLSSRPNTKIVIGSASDGVAISSLPVAFYPDNTGGARRL
jgi:hypothetical protein